MTTPLSKRQQRTVIIRKVGRRFEWEDEWSPSTTCILSRYRGRAIGNPSRVLKSLRKQLGFSDNLRIKFNESISHIDNEHGTLSDLKRMKQLAKLLGMNVKLVLKSK